MWKVKFKDSKMRTFRYSHLQKNLFRTEDLLTIGHETGCLSDWTFDIIIKKSFLRNECSLNEFLNILFVWSRHPTKLSISKRSRTTKQVSDSNLWFRTKWKKSFFNWSDSLSFIHSCFYYEKQKQNCIYYDLVDNLFFQFKTKTKLYLLWSSRQPVFLFQI